jgi:hypothetical protein
MTSVATRDNPPVRVDEATVEALIVAEAAGFSGIFDAVDFGDGSTSGSIDLGPTQAVPEQGSQATLAGGDAAPGSAGGTAALVGGRGDDGAFNGAEVDAEGGGAAAHGKTAILTNNTYGDAGQVLTSDGHNATWEDLPASGASPVVSAASLIYAFNSFR